MDSWVDVSAHVGTFEATVADRYNCSFSTNLSPQFLHLPLLDVV
jgi:hypothetical protein